MQDTLAGLTKKAIKAALDTDWKQAVEINSQILEIDENDTKAKTRLGRAYLQLSQFTKAKKLFEEVLKTDPINQIAKKHLELAKAKKSEKNSKTIDTKDLLREPGKTQEFELEINEKGITANSFENGEELEYKILKTGVGIYKERNSKSVQIAKIDTDLDKRLKKAQDQNAKISVKFINGKDKTVKIMFKSSVEVFKSQKQDIKPYIKKGTIDEPELTMAETE